MWSHLPTVAAPESRHSKVRSVGVSYSVHSGRGLTVVGHVSVSLLEDQVDAVPAPPDLFHGLTVRHPRRAVTVDLHQLIRHLTHAGHKHDVNTLNKNGRLVSSSLDDVIQSQTVWEVEPKDL